MVFDVTWFVPPQLLPWELHVLRCLAGGLRSRGVALEILSRHSGSWGTQPVLYWDAARVGERWRRLFWPRGLWHFWGNLPPWHGAISLRAKVIHTQWRTRDPWRGMASSFSSRGSRQGEALLVPAFDQHLLWHEGGDAPTVRCGEACLVVLVPPERRWVKGIREALRFRGETVQWIPWGICPKDFGEELPLSDALYSHWRERGGVLVLPTLPEGADGWLAAQGALMAVPSVAVASPVLDDLLGYDGYVRVDLANGATVEAWSGALERAFGGEGRMAAARARHHLELSFAPGVAGEALAALYRRVGIVEESR